MSTVFNVGGGIVSLPSTPLNTLILAVRASLGQNQITRNIGNFYATFDATNGAVQQQFSLAASSSLVLPTGSSGLLVASNGGALSLGLSKTVVTSIAISSITWNTGVVTVVLSAPHGIIVGSTATWTIEDVVPTTYNGTYTVTATTTNAFTYALASNPGAVTTLGSAEGPPVVNNYSVTVNQLYVSDDTLSGVTITNPGTTTVTGFMAYVPFTFVP